MDVYITVTVPGDVYEDSEAILCTLRGKRFYADDGEILILTDNNDYVIAVTPNDTDINNGNPVTSSAYLYAEPPERGAGNEDPVAVPGFGTGWEC